MPKAGNRFTAKGKSRRAATGIPGTTRSRLGKLADVPVAVLKEKSQALRDAGNDAIVAATKPTKFDERKCNPPE